MTDQMTQNHAVLDVTYVLYDESSTLAHLLALLTLSPILLNPAYAALAVYTRELIFVEMWAGQMLCEAFNWVLKHIIKEERPHQHFGPGYGFPSSHSQWMGYFAAFLMCHFAFRHRFVTTGSILLDRLRDCLLYLGIAGWAGAVAYSRYYLTYHSARQVLWGSTIGVLFGVAHYALVELIPTRYPNSLLGHARTSLIQNPLSIWLRVRDGWSAYPDGGTEAQWQQWRQACRSKPQYRAFQKEQAPSPAVSSHDKKSE